MCIRDRKTYSINVHVRLKPCNKENTVTCILVLAQKCVGVGIFIIIGRSPVSYTHLMSVRSSLSLITWSICMPSSSLEVGT